MVCSGLASNIDDYQKFESHDAYVEKLKKAHGRKSGFWGLLQNNPL
jgi:endonuclease YncB( thermonuclease family)